MSDTAVQEVEDTATEAKTKVRHRAEFVEEDVDDIPELTRTGRKSELKRRVAKVREDNTGKPRLIAKYHSAASASSAATAQRKAFAGEGYRFAVRALDDGVTGLFVIWKEEWVGADDAPKPRKRKAKSGAEAIAEPPADPSPEVVAAAEKASNDRRGRR